MYVHAWMYVFVVLKKWTQSSEYLYTKVHLHSIPSGILKGIYTFQYE